MLHNYFYLFIYFLSLRENYNEFIFGIGQDSNQNLLNIRQ